MKMENWVHHGCWAGLVLVAYLAGRGREAPVAEPEFVATGGAGVVVGGVAGGDAVVVQGGSAEEPGGGLVGRAVDGAGVDWESLAREAAGDPSPVKRRLAFARLLEALTPENALDVRERLLEFGLGGDEWRDFNYRWGALAGEEAVVFAASSEEEDLEAAMSGWASASPEAAMAFLDRLPEEMRGQRDQYALSVASGLADVSEGVATSFVYEYANGGGGGAERMMDLVARKALRGGDFRSAAAWSETLPDGALKGSAMRRVADLYAKRDPEGAAAWAGRYADNEFAVRVIEEVGDHWAERDPVAAVGWLESLPEGGAQLSGMTSVFGDWEDRDPLAASEYLLSMPQSEQRDSAISGFSRGYAWQDPEAAITWAQDIGDPQLRQETLTRAGEAYMRRQPDSALAWLESSGLPAESVKRILESGRRR